MQVSEVICSFLQRACKENSVDSVMYSAHEASNLHASYRLILTRQLIIQRETPGFRIRMTAFSIAYC